MKKYLLLLATIALCSCGHNKIDDGRLLYKMYFKQTLKAPSTFKVINEKYKENGDTIGWSIKYEAQNALGVPLQDFKVLITYKDRVQCEGVCYRLVNGSLEQTDDKLIKTEYDE